MAGAVDAATLIDEIERQNAFLIPSGDDGERYHYHNLFAELLGSTLKRFHLQRYESLLNEAATVCEQRGLTDDAIVHALKAGNIRLAADIVDRNMEGTIGAGEVTRLRSWLRLFAVPAGPAAHVSAVEWAWCRTFEGNRDAALEMIDRVEIDHLRDFDRDPTGQLDVMWAIVVFQAKDPSLAESYAKRGLKSLPQSSGYIECLGHLYVGRASTPKHYGRGPT